MRSSISAICAFRVYIPSRSIRRRALTSREIKGTKVRKKKKKEKRKRREEKSALGFQAGSNRGSTAIAVET